MQIIQFYTSLNSVNSIHMPPNIPPQYGHCNWKASF